MLTDDARTPDIVTSTKLGKGLRAMSIKEKIRIHKEIEAENKRKLKEWRDRK